MTSPLLRYTYELFLGGAWVDITTSVRHRQGVKVQRGKTDGSRKLTPAKATLTLENKDDRFNPQNPLGPYYGQLVRNTPIRISCAGAVPNAARFYGEVFAFAPQWNENRSDCSVPITASGVLRRIADRELDPSSYYRAWLNTRTLNPKPRFLWPLEDGSDAGGALPEIGQGTATTRINPGAVGNPPVSIDWGKAVMNDWLPNGVAIGHQNEIHFPCDMRGASGTAWEVSMLLNIGADDVLNTGLVDCGTVQYLWAISTDAFTDPTAPAGKLSVYIVDAISFQFDDVTPALPPLKEVGPLWLTIRSTYASGTTTTYAVWRPVREASNSITVNTVGTRATAGIEWPRSVAVAAVNNDVLNPNAKALVGLSCLSVSECSNGTAGMGLSYTATKAAPGEWTFDRFARLCDQFGFNNDASGNGSVQLGRQYLQGFEDHLQEIIDSSAHAGIVESRTANELILLGTGAYRGVIDYTECSGELAPVEDDQETANIVTVSQSHGSATTLRKATGVMSVATIGPFTGKLDTNNWTFSHALALAGRMLAVGTWSGPRFTEVTVSARANPAQYAKYRSIDVGDFITLDGMESAGYYNEMVFRVVHVAEELRHEDHTFTFTIVPGDIDLLLWTIGTNALDIADSTVAVASSGATIDVNVPTAKWATTGTPYDLMISGEQVTVIAVSNLTSTTQRLSVTRGVNGVLKTSPVGAEVHIYPGFYIKAV